MAADQATVDLGPSEQLAGFLDRLPRNAAILELGCGGGRDSMAMRARGFDVDTTDGCAAMAKSAETRIGHRVRVLRFSDIDAEARYDAVWAQACLLHVERVALSGILARIHSALKPGGLFFASYKAGQAEGRDRWGRYFNYPDIDWLRTAYESAADWASFEIETGRGSGYNGEIIDWHRVIAGKP